MMRRCSSQPHSPESHKVCPKRCVERQDWGNAKVMRSKEGSFCEKKLLTYSASLNRQSNVAINPIRFERLCASPHNRFFMLSS